MGPKMGPIPNGKKLIFPILCLKIPHCILFYILISRDSFPIKTLQRERALNFYLKENVSFIPHLKAVQYCFPISQNVNNFPNVDGPLTLFLKGM